MENNDIKSLTPLSCPHCQKPIILEFINKAPELAGTYTPEMLEMAKKDALSKIEALNLPEEFTKPTVDWINNPDNIFSPNDVDSIVNSIKKFEDQDDEQEEEDEETP